MTDPILNSRIRDMIEELHREFPTTEFVLLGGDPIDGRFEAYSSCHPEEATNILLSALSAMGFDIHVVKDAVPLNARRN